MTGDDMRAELRTLVDDDNIAEAQELRWINQAYDRINAMRIWNYLRKEDSSKTVVSGTVSYALPSDFLYPSEDHFFLLDASLNVTHTIKFVPMKSRLRYKNTSGFAYVDLANSNLIFTADDSSFNGRKIYLPYQYQPTQLIASTSPVFNRAFHMGPVYFSARHFWYNDQQEKDRSFIREMDTEFDRVLSEMIQWDNHLDFAFDSSYHPLDNWAPGVD